MAAVKQTVNEEIEQLRPSELREWLILAIESGLVPAVWGSIGIGKSSVVKQVAAYFRAIKPKYGYLEYRTATQEPTDVTGVPMPNMVNKTTEFFKPARLKELPEDWEGIVFLDEFTKSPPSVTNAWSQPILDGCIDDFELPKGLRFVIAGNRRVDKSSDTDLGMFMYNRIVQVEMVTDVDDVVAHFKALGVRDDLCAFLKFGGAEYLNNYNPDKKVHATPRTWEMVGKLADQAERRNSPEILLQAGVSGLVGKGPGYAYMSFRKMLSSIPPVSQVIADPMGTKLFDDPSTAYALALCLARKAAPDNIEQIMKYTGRCNIEIEAAFVADSIKRTPALKETRSYIEWAAKHKDLELS